MPIYEIILLLPKMDKSSLKTVLKRSAEYIFEVGGTIRKMENLGFMTLPYKIKGKQGNATEAHHFLMNCDAAEEKIKELHDKFKRDKNVLRFTSFCQALSPENLIKKKPEVECDLHLDFLPPPYRPNVIKLQNMTTKARIKAFKNRPRYDHENNEDLFGD